MNFLAHLFLSGKPGGRMVGNFIADSVKGSDFNNYPEEIQEGIKLHRAIDTYTDSHEIVLKSKERLRTKFGKYAPVVADVFYDHFLAVNWESYSKTNLRDFTTEAYRFLKEHYPIFPERSKQFYQYMITYDILFAYAKPAGIDKVMQGMSRRAKFSSGMEYAKDELMVNYKSYKEEFILFFPQLQQYCQDISSD